MKNPETKSGTYKPDGLTVSDLRTSTVKLTKGQRDFLSAVYEDEHKVFHRRVVQPMFDAGYVFPRQGNMLFWLVGCNGHASTGLALQAAGYTALTGEAV